MPAFLPILLTLLQLDTGGAASDCRSWPSRTGDRSLVACRQGGITIASLRVGESAFVVRDGSGLLAESAIHSAVWSPAEQFVALDVGLDEASTVVLVDNKGERVVDIGSMLSTPDVDAEGPVWDSKGDWLVFHTTGAGGNLNNDGVYAVRMADMTVHRFLLAQVSDVAITNDTLKVTLRRGEPAGAERTHSLAAVIRGATLISQPPPRRRGAKE